MSPRPGNLPVLALAAALMIAACPATAQDAMLQCVPYARQVSGIEIYGDAHSWWQQADGRYERGKRPAPGAVLAFKPHRSMQLGHVAAVSKVIDSRRVLLDHANWSPINGRKGQVERNVLAEDVSAANDWSEVRVWYSPIGGLGTTRYPVHGFIYPQGRKPQDLQAAPVQIASADQPTGKLSRAERKAQRQAEKEARKRLKQIEKQRREYAKYLKKQQKAQRERAGVSVPSVPRLEADPIGDLIGRSGG
ncbi:CHAP domain-containing protein [Sphingomonas sp. 35-24ZXX]|uniref:CHAP domain-containing protein n=1 Tax=Sphingomonas sp. 35-24ZXX TaxID=1545915 RepID=UPI00053BEF8B